MGLFQATQIVEVNNILGGIQGGFTYDTELESMGQVEVLNTITSAASPESMVVTPMPTQEIWVAEQGPSPNNRVRIYDPITLNLIATIDPGIDDIQAIAFAPNVDRIYGVSSSSQDIVAIDRETRSVVATFQMPTAGTLFDVAYSHANGMLYATTNNEQTVEVINPNTNAVVNTIDFSGVPGDPFNIIWVAAQQELWVTYNSQLGVGRIDPTTDTIVGAPISVGSTPRGLAYSSITGNVYVAAFGGNQIDVIDVETMAVDPSPVSVSNPGDPFVNPSTGLLYVPRTFDDAVDIISLVDKENIQSVPLGHVGFTAMYIPRTRRMAVLGGLGDSGISILT